MWGSRLSFRTAAKSFLVSFARELPSVRVNFNVDMTGSPSELPLNFSVDCHGNKAIVNESATNYALILALCARRRFGKGGAHGH
jgi:hypothetical protein